MRQQPFFGACGLGPGLGCRTGPDLRATRKRSRPGRICAVSESPGLKLRFFRLSGPRPRTEAPDKGMRAAFFTSL